MRKSAFLLLGALLALVACPGPEDEDCRNDEDDDGDGQVDCNDADCRDDRHCKDDGDEGERHA